MRNRDDDDGRSRHAITARQAEKLLRRHGFVAARISGSHHGWRRNSQTLVLGYRKRSERVERRELRVHMLVIDQPGHAARSRCYAEEDP